MKRKSALLALAVGFLMAASVQAVPTTYQYTGNPFTTVSGPYTTSDFVTAMITLATPLGPNFSGSVSPIAFTFSDGVQTITNLNATFSSFFFQTGPTGAIIGWVVNGFVPGGHVASLGSAGLGADEGESIDGRGLNSNQPGTWAMVGVVPDTGSTLSLMTLTLMALGLVARRFQRPAV